MSKKSLVKYDSMNLEIEVSSFDIIINGISE
jgi:hypothetical protein